MLYLNDAWNCYKAMMEEQRSVRYHITSGEEWMKLILRNVLKRFEAEFGCQ